ncbi:MAG: exopolysaccharide biosynthesis polyprenyl glycosylphosphotransferase [candidate division KSB1 bacterium]|nr:exopolysaccharide biosynthesis polyprenyl glycosylphosphotransferase [candidate division KSB1 bacterium]MDZ7335033.1 exopolysaccharide biosynthesis polyprenyl glycosylphosphotransferase [candidate division KSB1 bacterium]MDZ7357780.1 exopolysaccharide biosynthesis polyprenyl glycosylphosphotransferase [candidate division KSB1 bacterium]MDZ7377538.1 exopolysaccharide biosynthesis polyprenyl glycosylphosphotransferase [candidate division KSB1 bacterium]MDZ7399402.1 exopolysaccharide biosynthes
MKRNRIQKENWHQLLQKLARQKIQANLLKQKNGRAQLEALNNGYFHSLEYFRQRYLIEKRRAERKAYDFSLIVIELPDADRQPRSSEALDQPSELSAILLATLKTILRTTDVVARSGATLLFVLLPDTNAEGAATVMQRMNQELSHSFELNNGNPRKLPKIKCYSYPEESHLIESLIDSDLVATGESTRHIERVIRKASANYYRMMSDENLGHGSALISAGSAIAALPNPFLVLSEAFYDWSDVWQKIAKRAIDIVFSICALIFFAPVMLIIALIIKLTSPGPVFFKQERIGYLGKKFVMYKFRTMHQSQDDQIHKNYIKDFIHNCSSSQPGCEDEQPIFKIKNDPRVTRIGKFLRRTSLDELGQFINVLKGDMSLVGPRPPIPYEVELYDLWHRRRFLSVKPGITGLWQIYGRSTTAFNEMIRLDLAYAQNWSLKLDIKILLKTIGAVLSMKGAY